jgi:group I intron endonuclease
MEQPNAIFGYVYLITNLVNGKKYVGCTIAPIKRRWGEHLSVARRGGRGPLHAAIRKYGPNSFTIEAVRTILGTHDDLMSAEIRCIASYGTLSPSGYNLTAGGEGVDYTLQEVRERQLAGVRKRSSDPEWLRRQIEKNRRLASDPVWLAANTVSNRRLAADPKWRATNASKNRQMYTTPKWKQAVYEAARRRASDTSWKEANAEKNRRLASDPAWVAANAANLTKANFARLSKAHAMDAALPPETRARRIANREAARRYKARKKGALASQQI